jgi:hypothetical protein
MTPTPNGLRRVVAKWRPRPQWLLRVLFLASGLILANCGNCSSPSTVEAHASEPPQQSSGEKYWRVAGIDPPAIEYLPFETDVFLQGGEIDFYNQYPWSVMLTTQDPGQGARCSAVLLSPQIALTAGHCVCARRKSLTPEGTTRTLIDALDCARLTYITTVFFRGGRANLSLLNDLELRTYTGEVQPHPELQVVLDEQANVVARRADLALIALHTPVSHNFPSLPIAQDEAQTGESLVMSGFGSDERFDQLPGIRYFRRDKVTAALGDGHFLYEQQGAYLYNGFNGGPCVREDKRGRSLIGIASLGTEKELAFTSTVFYRQWIESQSALLLKTARPSPRAPGAPR